MPKKRTKRERADSKARPDYLRDIADLAALVVGRLAPHEPGHESRSLMIFVWRDCAMTVKYPDGQRMHAHPEHGHTHTLDSAVHELAVGVITEYCEGAGIAVAEIRVHMVPSQARTREQIFTWLQSIPGISISILPPKEIGFGGPLPPASEAG